MRKLKAFITAVALAAGVLAGAPTASAADLEVTDGDSNVTFTTPILAPAGTTCTAVPYTYELTDAVETATVKIVDSNGTVVVTSAPTPPGVGSGELSICKAGLAGTTAPYVLQLDLVYAADSGLTNHAYDSATFTLTAQTITCRKLRKPHKGQVRKFSAPRCPRGWVPVAR